MEHYKYNPEKEVDWWTGLTRSAAKAIFANSLFVDITQKGSAANLLYKLGFNWDSENKTYHARTDAWQQVGGFNDFYDMIFNSATSMASAKFEFSVDERNYIFWAWKGNYLNLGAGAELGIYSNQSGIAGMVNVASPFDEHWLVDTSLAMDMSLSLMYYGIDPILSYDANVCR